LAAFIVTMCRYSTLYTEEGAFDAYYVPKVLTSSVNLYVQQTTTNNFPCNQHAIHLVLTLQRRAVLLWCCWSL